MDEETESKPVKKSSDESASWIEDEADKDAELTVDVYQTSEMIVVKDVPEAVQAPPRLLATHKRNRVLSPVAGAPLGWSVEDSWAPWIAYRTGKFGTLGSAKVSASDRFDAIAHYRELIALSQPSGKDSTCLNEVKGGSGFPVSETQCDAIKKKIAIDSRMPEKDRHIVKHLCDGQSLARAVEYSCGTVFKHTTIARVCDALDALIEATMTAKRASWTFDLRLLAEPVKSE